MRQIGVFETIKGRDGERETFTELFDSHPFGKVFLHQMENERQGIGTVRDDDIREDGMGAPAGGTDDPKNDQTVKDNLSLFKSDETPLIGGMADAVAG
jgi:hypothetical protein